MNQIILTVSRIIASGLGSGLTPASPGTVGTLAALPIWLLLGYLGFNRTLTNELTIIGIVCLLGLVTSHILCRQEPQSTNKIDPQYIVIDEWAGIFITLIGTPYYDTFSILCGFALFRLFDITKPIPVRWGEKLPGGWGVMMDDILAGGIAFVFLTLIKSYY